MFSVFLKKNEINEPSMNKISEEKRLGNYNELFIKISCVLR